MVLVDKKKEGLIPLIERKAGLKMQRIGTPQPSDLARVAGLPPGLGFINLGSNKGSNFRQPVHCAGCQLRFRAWQLLPRCS